MESNNCVDIIEDKFSSNSSYEKLIFGKTLKFCDNTQQPKYGAFPTEDISLKITRKWRNYSSRPFMNCCKSDFCYISDAIAMAE